MEQAKIRPSVTGPSFITKLGTVDYIGDPYTQTPILVKFG